MTFDENDMLQDSILFDGWFNGMREQYQSSKGCRQHCRFPGVGDELRRWRNPTRTPKPSGHYRRRQHIWKGELWVIHYIDGDNCNLTIVKQEDNGPLRLIVSSRSLIGHAGSSASILSRSRVQM